MECSCVYVNHESSIFAMWSADLGFIPAKRVVYCDECGAAIAPGELHEKYCVQWEHHQHFLRHAGVEGEYRSYRTCPDCHSIRKEFFCDGWIWTQIIDDLWDHIVSIDGELSETCLIELTPGGRAMVCDLIEDMWRMGEGIREEIGA